MRREFFPLAERQQIRSRIAQMRRILSLDTPTRPCDIHQQTPETSPQMPFGISHLDCLVFLAHLAPTRARQTLEAVFSHQREDGLFPSLRSLQSQRVPQDSEALALYPLAQVVLDSADACSLTPAQLLSAYRACCRYDDWLMKRRNTHGTGLVESVYPEDAVLGDESETPPSQASDVCGPILSVELSAMLYGQRQALGALAQRLSLPEEAASWHTRGEETRQAILDHLYDAHDDFFYDRSPKGFLRYRTEHITHLFMNHVLRQDQFDSLYDRYFMTPAAGFLPDYPLPAMAVDDPHFDDDCPAHSKFCSSHAITALQSLFWMDAYHREEDQAGLLSIWLKSLVQNDFCFTSEINPFNGKVRGNHHQDMASMLLFLEAVRRLQLD